MKTIFLQVRFYSKSFLTLVLLCLFHWQIAFSQSFYDDPISALSGYSVYSGNIGDKNATSVRGNAHGENGVTVGYFNDITDFGNYHLGGPDIIKTSQGEDDIFILERHPDSGLNWLRTIGGPGNDQALSVDSENGESVITGFFSGTVDFDPDPIATANKTSMGSTDIFVLCLSSTGTFNWVYTMGSLGKDWGNSVSVSRGVDGNVYVTGTFEQSLYYPLSGGATGVIPSKGGTDAFIAKFDVATGAVGFVESIGGEDNDSGTYVHAHYDGAVYLTGDFSGIADVDPGIGVYNLEADATDPSVVGIYNERIDGSGNLVWADKIVGSASNSHSGAISGSSDGVYVVGVAAGLTDVDPGPGTYWINPIGSANNVGFLIKKDPLTGALIWVRSINSANNLDMTDVFMWKSSWGDQIYISGIFNGSVGLEKGGGFYENLTTPSQGSFIASYHENGDLTNSRALDNTRILSVCHWEHACPSHTGGWIEFCGSFNNTVDFSDDPAVNWVETNIGGRDGFTCTWFGGCSPPGSPEQGKSIIAESSHEVKGANLEENILIVPNPTQGLFAIELMNSNFEANSVVKVVDVSGKTVMTTKLVGNNPIDISSLESGVYFLKITSGNERFETKILKK